MKQSWYAYINFDVFLSVWLSYALKICCDTEPAWCSLTVLGTKCLVWLQLCWILRTTTTSLISRIANNEMYAKNLTKCYIKFKRKMLVCNTSTLYFLWLGKHLTFLSSWGVELEWRLLSVLLVTSDIKVESKCEGTLCAGYLSQHVCNYFAILELFLQVQYFWSNITQHWPGHQFSISIWGLDFTFYDGN